MMENNLPVVVIGAVDGRTVVDRMLNKVEDNFPSKKHVLKGFYTEHTEDGAGRILGYGETRVDVYKEGYKKV